MSFSRLPQTRIALILSQLLSGYSEQYKILLIGHINGTVAPVPQPGYVGPSINLNEPFRLPAIQDPQLMVSYLQSLGLNGTFGVSQEISLGTPTSVSEPVNGSVTLTWATRPANFGQLTVAGNGTVAQATSLATGTYGGIATSGTYSVIVTDVTGTFNTTNAVTVTITQPGASVIDATLSDEIVCMVYNSLVESLSANTQSANVPTPTIYIACLASDEAGFGPSDADVFDFVFGQTVYYNTIVMPYTILSTEDVDVNYVRFFQAIAELNLPSACQQQFYGTMGVWGVTAVDKNSQADLVTSNTPYVSPAWYPYSNTNIVAQLPAQIAAAAATVMYTNPPPFNALNEVVLNSLVPPDNVNEGAKASNCEVALDQGYTPIAINQTNQAAFVRTITSMITYPNTSLPATQYFDIQPWQVLFLFRGAAYLYLTSFINQKLTNSLCRTMQLGLIDLANTFQTENMIENVSQYLTQFSVTISPVDGSQAIVAIPLEVIPGLQSINASIYLQNTFGTLNVSGFNN